MLIKLHIVSGCFYATVTEHQLNNLLFPLKRFPLKKKKISLFPSWPVFLKLYTVIIIIFWIPSIKT